MVILENIDIDKAILQNINIDKISNRFKFGLSNRATSNWIHDTNKFLKTGILTSKIAVLLLGYCH